MPVFVYLIFTGPAIFWIRRSASRSGNWFGWDAVLLFYVVPLVVLCGKVGLVSMSSANAGCALIAITALALTGVRLAGPYSRGADGPKLLLAILMILVLGGFIIGAVAYSRSFSVIIRGLPTYIAILLGLFVALNHQRREEFLQVTSRIIPVTAFGALVLVQLWPELATISTSSFESQYAPEGRLSGPLLHPNALGSLCAIGLVLAATLGRGLERVLGIAVCGITVVLTDQRSAQLAVAAALIVIALSKLRQTPAFWFVVTLTPLTLIAGIYGGGSALAAGLFGRREESLSVRQGIYEFIFSNVDFILPFGIGPTGLYESTNGAYFESGVAHAHNTWLSFFVIGGLLSGLIFAFVTIWAAVSLRKPGVGSGAPLFVAVVLLGVAEAPAVAGSNWTIVPIAAVSILAMMPIIKVHVVGPRPRQSKSAGIGAAE